MNHFPKAQLSYNEIMAVCKEVETHFAGLFELKEFSNSAAGKAVFFCVPGKPCSTFHVEVLKGSDPKKATKSFSRFTRFGLHSEIKQEYEGIRGGTVHNDNARNLRVVNQLKEQIKRPGDYVREKWAYDGYGFMKVYDKNGVSEAQLFSDLKCFLYELKEIYVDQN